MKKLTSFLTFAIVAILSFSFTSCDEDHEIAIELNGTWNGTISADRDDYYVDIRFNQSGFTRHGWGYEYDEPMGYGRGTYSRFNWRVDDGNIYLNYDDGSHVVISDYHLDSRYGKRYLVGRLQEVRNGWTMGYINLQKLEDDPYDSGYDAWAKKNNIKLEDDEE